MGSKCACGWGYLEVTWYEVNQNKARSGKIKPKRRNTLYVFKVGLSQN